MGKKKYIIIAVIIFILGFGLCLKIAGENRLPEEKMEQRPGVTDTEMHTFISD